MKYKCENELHTLSFKDFNVEEIKYTDNKITLYTNGGVARYNNSCNETLEERYISECEIQFINCSIEKFILEGGKYYTADDVLIEEVPDTVIKPEEIKGVLKKLKGEDAVIFFLNGNAEGDSYKSELAVDLVNDTYWINITAEKVIVGFDRFMNRVMN